MDVHVPLEKFRAKAWSKLRSLLSIDPRSLALLRVGLGVIVLLDVLQRTGDVRGLYADTGVLPIAASWNHLHYTAGHWSLHWLHGSWQWQGLLLLGEGVAALAMLVGYRSRLATVATWVLVASLNIRNPMVTTHGDALLQLCLFWSVFLPLGARFSLDALRRGEKPAASGPVFSAATVAIMLQLCLMYWVTAAQKTHPMWTETHWALYYALNADFYTTPFAKWLLGFPEFTRWLTFSTLWLEWLGPLLLFVPLYTDRIRLAVIAAFVGLHLGIALCLTIGFFSWICIVCWTVFLPGSFWDGLEKLVKRNVRGDSAITPRNLEIVSAGATTGLYAGKLANVVAALLLLYVIVWNLGELFPRSLSWFHDRTRPLANALRLEQNWNMFAPYPELDDGWFLAVATLEDGSQIDLLAAGRPVTWDKPQLISAAFKNHRWMTYASFLRKKEIDKRLRHYYVEYLKRNWRAQHPGGPAIRKAELYFFLEKTVPYPEVPELKLVLMHYDPASSLKTSQGDAGLTPVDEERILKQSNEQFQGGLKLAEQHKWSEAADAFRRAVDLRPNFFEALYNLASMEERQGEGLQARLTYEHALRFRPDSTAAHEKLARLLARLGEWSRAEPHFERVVRAKPQDAEVHYNLGVVLIKQDKRRQAIGHFQEALRIRPDFPQARSYLQRSGEAGQP